MLEISEKNNDLIKYLRKKYNKSLLNKKEVAEELGISLSGIDRLRKGGQLSSKTVLGSVYFTINEISSFIGE